MKFRGHGRGNFGILLFIAIVLVFSIILFVLYSTLLNILETNQNFNGIGLVQPQDTSAVEDDCSEIIKKLQYRCENTFKLPTNYKIDQFHNYDSICGHDTRTDIKYLPDPKLLTCLKKFEPPEWKEAQENLFKKIYKLQNPNDCNNPNSNEYTIPTWLPDKDEFGFQIKTRRDIKSGNEMKDNQSKWNLIGWLHHGYAYNLFVFTWNAGNHWSSGVSVITGNSKYRFSDINCGKSWSCYWSSLSSCKLSDINNKSILVYYETCSQRLVMDISQLCKPYGYYDYYNGRCLCNDGFMPSRFDQYTGCAPYHSFDFEHIHRRDLHRQKWEDKNPKVQYAVREGDDFYFSLLAPSENNPGLSKNPVHGTRSKYRKKFGFLWEHAQWLWYLHKDTPKKQYLDDYLIESGLPVHEIIAKKKRAVGIHVRHGDSCHDKYQNHRVCLPLDDFMTAVKELESVYGKYDVIFLATDDPQVIEDTVKYEKEGYKFTYQKISRYIYEHGDHNGVDVRLEFNDPQIVKEIVADIWGISYCDAFVGSFASSVAWVAYELMIGRSGYYPPYISVDMPYADKKNVGRFLDTNI